MESSKRILVIGDLHFRVKNLSTMDILCKEIIDAMDSRKPDLCVMLGDTLDTHERIHIQPITAATNFLRECAKRCRVILLIGNHDRENNNDFQSIVHPFNGLKDNPNITVVDKAIWDAELNFIYVPYVYPGRFREALSTVGWTLEGEQPDIGFAHQEFRGAADGSHVSEHGDNWSHDMFQIYTGHYHGYQILPKVFYVGTPIQHKFGDNPDTALLLIHITNIKGEGKSRRSDRTHERIPIMSVQKKVTIHLTKDELDIAHQKIPYGYEVKVVLHVNDSESAAIQKDPRYLALCETVKSVAIKTINDKVSLASQAMDQLKIEQRLDLEEVIVKMLASDLTCQSIFQEEICK